MKNPANQVRVEKGERRKEKGERKEPNTLTPLLISHLSFLSFSSLNYQGKRYARRAREYDRVTQI
jgi:hypothetical protein